MNTSKLAGRLAPALALAAMTAPAFAQTTICDEGPPVCEEGVPTPVGPFTDTFMSTSSPMDVLLAVPKYNGPDQLVGIDVEFSFTVEGSVEYTNNTTAECTGHSWVNELIVAPIDSPDAPLCPSFPVEPPIYMNGDNFSPTPANGGMSFGVFPENGYCDTCDNLPIMAGTFTDPANIAAFSGAGDVSFVTAYQDNTTCVLQCNPGICSFVHEFNATLKVTYYVCMPDDDPSDCVCAGPSPHYREPGSLLLFPEFSNREGDVTVVTVTNADCTLTSDDTIIEYIYIDEDDCGEFNRTETLTPCDTFTVLTGVHNPGHEQGYLYVFAKNERDEAVVCNNLIGNLLVYSGFDSFDYSVNPVAFKGVGNAGGIIQPKGTPTDLDGDTLLDLDGKEYEQAPDTITVPRFLGQDDEPGPGLFQSQLILISLSGGAAFDETWIDCLIYNDNEVAFSFDHNFYCWEKSYLRDISFAFSNDYLKTTDHDPNEILGEPSRESGWLCCDGLVANSSTESIEDPAFYMMLVERVGDFGVADLPFECGVQDNGTLLPRDLNGDGDPIPEPGDNM